MSNYLSIAVFLTLYVLVSIIAIIGNVSLMAALASSGASLLRSPQLLSGCAADLLVCAASATLAATRAARIQHLPCHVSYYIESLSVAASTFSLVAIAADRHCAVQRGRSSLCSKPYLAVTSVWVAALILDAITVITTCLSWPPLAAAHAVVTLRACSSGDSMSLDGSSQTYRFIADGTRGAWRVASSSASYAAPNSRHYSSWCRGKGTP